MIVLDQDHGKTRIRLEQPREEFHITDQTMNCSDVGDGRVRARLDLLLPRRQLHEFLSALVALPAVREIRELHPDSDGPTGTATAGPAS